MASVVLIKDGLHTGANPATPTVGIVTAEEARLSNGAGFARLGSGLLVRTGVLYHGVQTLIASTATTAPSMTVAVSPLAVVGQKAAGEGVYVPTSPGTVLLDIAAAPGANSRIDVVYAMQRDAGSATSPDATTQAELGVITGTAAVSPAKPAIPVGAVEVGTVTVAAGATATSNASVSVATTCRWTVPLGAPIPVRNQTERDAITAYKGVTVDRLDANRFERFDGATWAEPGVATTAAVTAAHKPLTFHAATAGSVPAGMGVVSVGSITVTGAAVTAGYLHAGVGSNAVRVLKPCVLSLTALFYIPTASDKQGAIGVGTLTSWYANTSTTSDRVSASLNYAFTALTDIVCSQRAAAASAGTTLTIDGYLIPMD